VHPSTPAAPLWVRALTAGGRPIVLGVALLMCAPGEYHLARAAGWADRWAYGMPVVLSAYAGIASAVASVRRPGDRGRWSAIIGAILALSLAMAAQVVSHLIGTSIMTPHHAVLIAAISLVPPAVVGHLLHLAATPPEHQAITVPATEDAPAARRPPARPVVPPGVRLLPITTRPVAQSQTLLPVAPPPGVRLLPLVATTPDAPDATPVGPSGARLITTREMAARRGVAQSTVRNWIRDGVLQPVHTDARGRHWLDPSASPELAAARA